MKRSYLSLFFIVLASMLHAKVLRVNNTANIATGYISLTSAVAVATAEDTIHIEGSVTPYTENVTIDKKLVIIGPGYFLGNTPETQYNKESAKLNGNITFTGNSKRSVLAGIVQQTGGSGYTVDAGAYGTGNKVIIQSDSISIVGCKLFYVEISSAQPRNNIFIQRCFFNPGVITTTGTGLITNLTVTNCFFRNDNTANAPNYLVINSTTGIQSGWRISQCTFYKNFNVIAENTTFANNVFYGDAAISITSSTTNTYINNVMNRQIGGMANTVNQNSIVTDKTEEQWFSKAGGNAATDFDTYFTSATSTTVCPLRDNVDPTDDTKSKGMYGGGAPYVPSGMFTIPSVYDIVMDTEVGDSFNMTIKARTH